MSDSARSVLLVDDDADTCANMADILAEMGYAIDVAREGATALELVRRQPYDVAILDLRMPGMDGVELCREIQRVRSGTVALLLTAFADARTVLRALGAGFSDVLTKPADIPRLLGLIDAAIDQPLVLVVDDDLDLCANLLDLLRGHGFRVCIAHDGAEAFERLRESTRVVLLDLRLPGGDGGLVYRRVRAANPAARVILITGHRDELEATVRRLVDEGVDAVHYKPFDIPRLLEDVGRLVGAAQAG